MWQLAEILLHSTCGNRQKHCCTVLVAISKVLVAISKTLIHSTCGNRQNPASQHLWQLAEILLHSTCGNWQNTASQYLWQLAEILLHKLCCHSICSNQQKHCFTVLAAISRNTASQTHLQSRRDALPSQQWRGSHCHQSSRPADRPSKTHLSFISLAASQTHGSQSITGFERPVNHTGSPLDNQPVS